MRATDDAGNTESGPSRIFRIDNTDPSALYIFPAAGASYNAAGWNAGCATNGACGSHSDSGSGVAEVEVSLKRVSSDLYWDGDLFDAASETYFSATLGGGNWSLAFPAAASPADGAYTLHVRATDDAGNTEGAPPDLHLRHGRSPDDARLEPVRPDHLDVGGLRVLRQRGWLDLRVPHRQRRLERLHQPEELHEPFRRQPHLPGARHGRGGQHRRKPRGLHLDGRHDRSELHGSPGRRRRVQRRGLERRLRDERPLRHLRRRPRRLRRRHGRGLHPARLDGSLLERRLVLRGQRDVGQRSLRERRLVARLPGLELPGRRHVHRARPRDGRGR